MKRLIFVCTTLGMVLGYLLALAAIFPRPDNQSVDGPLPSCITISIEVVDGREYLTVYSPCCQEKTYKLPNFQHNEGNSILILD